MNYELRLMELQMASLLPKPSQEIKAAKQYDILQQIKEDTEVTISIPNLEAMINHAYEARINHLESRIDTISKAVQDLQKKCPERQTKHNPLPWWFPSIPL